MVKARRFAIITDTTVGPLHAEAVALSLSSLGEVSILSFDAGEQSKTRETWQSLSNSMLEQKFGRDSAVVAVGGGVVGDVAGFVAATYMRGVPVIHVPTTLLAMIDSSIGGKTGVDTPAGKNLIGAFHQPAIVLVDPSVLETLPREHVSNGLAEALKHGAISDAGYFDKIAQLGADPGIDDLAAIVPRSVEIKAAVVSEDEREAGLRAVLNFGHTVGHAVELVTDYNIPHGRAVSIGMVAEAMIGEAMSVTATGTSQHIRDALTALEIDCEMPPDCTRDGLLAAMSLDKKNRAESIRMTLLESIGQVAKGGVSLWTHAVDESIAAKSLRDPT